MSKTYVIQWKSRVNGRSGKGTKLFELDEAQDLAAQLNQEYPDIHHEVQKIEPQIRTGGTEAPHEPENETVSESQPDQAAHDPSPVLSFNE